jgi:hypothetical protein
MKHSLMIFGLLASTNAVQAQQLPPVRPLGPVVATSKEPLRAVSAVRQLPDGRVLVNDISGRKVVMFDSALAAFTVVADTTPTTANAYSSRAGGLISYRGDSTLFVDPTSMSMLVIDGQGKIARAMAAPRPNEVGALIGGPMGTPGFDASGRLVYRAPPQFRFQPPAPGAAPTPPQLPDSAAIVRIDLSTRKLDTVAFIKVARPNMTMTQDANGRTMMTSIMNPMPIVDDWAVLADGSVAVLRSSDYHIDWLRPDGTKESSPKIPFAWRRMSDEDKVAFIDSTKAAMEKLREQALAARAAGTAGPGVAGAGGAERVAAVEGAAVAMGSVMIFRGGPGEGPRPTGPARDSSRNGAGNFTIPPLQFVPPSELPDYAPPFTSGAARGDVDGNLWVRTSYAVNGGPVYDIIDAKGQLKDRVQLPAGRVVSGFGPGVVYMGVRDSTGVRLEKARIR